jgi:hypothetical protein
MITFNEFKIYKEEVGEHLHNVKIAFEKLNLTEAIEKAAKSIDPTKNNKLFSHQKRVGYKVANMGYEELKLKEKEINHCQSFEEILAITDKVSQQVYRLGPLWSYDTALRIGFQKTVYPKYVYIQAGVRKGYKKIFNHSAKARFVEKIVFPKELQALKPYEIENFLCIWGSKKLKKTC